MGNTVDVRTADVLVGIADVIENNQILNDWCQSIFNKLPTIYVGWNAADLPEFDEDNPLTSEYPLIVIAAITHTRGEGQQQIPFGLFMGFIVVNKNKLIAGRKRIFEGMLQVEGLRERTEEVLYRELVIRSPQSDSGYDMESIHPFHESYSTFTYTSIRSSSKPIGR